MNNPFVFGEAVEDEAFCDRQDELRFLARDLKDSQKIFLISPRRYGKTSLLKKVLKTLASDGLITVYVDFYRASSIQSLIELYSSAIALAAESTIDKAIRFMQDILPRLRPKITLDANGAPALSLEPFVSKKDTMQAINDLFDLPARVAKRKEKRVVVVFDEFQEIANFDGESLEKAMRSYIQHHREVGYVFSGSKQHMLEDMSQRSDRAFYKIGKVFYLPKIPRAIFLKFLKEKFEQNGFSLENGAIERALDVAENVPYNVQFVCHELWDTCRDARRVSLADVDRVISVILDEQAPFFLPQWDAFSLNQRSILKAITRHGGTGVFSQDFLRASGVTSLPTLQTSLRLLVKKGVVDKQNGTYLIPDIFFREWIKKKM